MISERHGGDSSRRLDTVDALRGLLTKPDWWVTCALLIAVAAFYHYLVDDLSSLWRLFFFELMYDVIGLFYLIPLVYAALRLGLIGFVATWLFSLVLLLPRLSRWSLGNQSYALNTVYFFIVFAVGAAIMLALHWRARHDRLTEEREIERQMHIEHVYKAQEEERQRIAQDLHDDVLQQLLAIAYALDGIAEDLDVSNPALSRQTATVRQDSVRLAEDLRRLSYDLRPTILDDLGLPSGIQWLLTRLQAETGIQTSFRQGGLLVRFDDEIQTAAFRTVQEALSNVRRHSHADSVRVKLTSAPDRLAIEIVDDGVGFDEQDATLGTARHGQLGLLGMRWRVASLNGVFTIQSRPGKGTRVMISIPLQGATRADDKGRHKDGVLPR